MPLSPLLCIFLSLPVYHTQSLQIPHFSGPEIQTFHQLQCLSRIGMGIGIGMGLLFSFFISYSFKFFFFISLFSIFTPLFADVDSRITPLPPPPPPPPNIGDITTTSSNPYPSPPPPSKPDASPFRPSVAVIVGVLTTMFSITFLLLLYAKHCKNGSIVHSGNNVDANYRAAAITTGRKNSGIDRAVIESLPIFRFSSLRGQKEGLECAVCLTRFEGTEVLRLLPKCKHAFHVECVDTWLDAHSTCPLCRYRVDPEDILLIEHDSSAAGTTTTTATATISQQQPEIIQKAEEEDPDYVDVECGRVVAESGGFRRLSGRHSSAGERASGWGGFFHHVPTSFRRSLDSSKKKTESTGVGRLDRRRKDGLLLTVDGNNPTRNVEHRIIISRSGSGSGLEQRWSDVQPSDLLYLRSEMIISDSRRFSASGSRQQENHQLNRYMIDGSGRGVINSRSVSEITGFSRFSSGVRRNNIINSNNRERQAGVASRWLAWISSLPAARSEA